MGDRRRARHHAGMHALLDPVLGRAREAQELDAKSELLRILDVEVGNVTDALDVDAGDIDRRAEGDRGQDRELVGGIDAVDVEARIRLGVSPLLRLRQHRGEAAPALAHRGENEIRGAVQDAVDPRHVIGGEPLAQRLEDRDAAGHRRLEGKGHALLLGELRELGAVPRHQRLVRGHHVLAARERGAHDVERHALAAADELHHDIGLSIGRQCHGIVIPAHRGKIDATLPAPVAGGNRAHLKVTAAAAGQQLCVAVQQLQRAGSHGAESGDGDVEGRFHGRLAMHCAAVAARRLLYPRTGPVSTVLWPGGEQPSGALNFPARYLRFPAADPPAAGRRQSRPRSRARRAASRPRRRRARDREPD